MKTPTAEQLAAAAMAAREIITPVTSDNRNAVRKYLTALGVEYAVAGRLTLAQLREVADKASRGEHYTAAAFVGGAPIEHEPIENDPQTPAAPAVPAAPAGNDAAARTAAALRELIASATAAATPAPAALDEKRVIELVRLHAPAAPTIRVEIGDRPAVEIGRQHFRFPLLLATIAARVPAFLVGPAGTGKTSAAHAAANALGLPFYAISVGPMTSKSDLFGMRDANGVYHESDLVKAATTGGVFLFDEFDAGNPATLTAVNMLLANGSFSTPAGMREKHADFIPVFALNTYGTGASREYVGRNQLDAATLDRGAFIDWPLDESLEAALVGVTQAPTPFSIDAGGFITASRWHEIVVSTRAKVKASGLRHIISPRATLYGAAMIAAGIGQEHLVSTLLHKGLDAAAVAKLTA
jgi:AAA domain (dynein-related subfamily)